MLLEKADGARLNLLPWRPMNFTSLALQHSMLELSTESGKGDKDAGLEARA